MKEREEAERTVAGVVVATRALPDILTKPSYQVRMGMTNFDNSIAPDAAACLSKNLVLQHSAWNFCGYVWEEDGTYYETVWVHGSPRASYASNDLRDLMDTVNDAFGWE